MVPPGPGFKNSDVATFVMSAKNCPDASRWMSFSLALNVPASVAGVLKAKRSSLWLWNDETLANEWVAFVFMLLWIVQRIR